MMTKDSTSTAKPSGNAKLVNLKDIERSDKFRCRKQENAKTVKEYADVFADYEESLKEGEHPVYPFPPVGIWKDNTGQYHLVTGFHRYAAAEAAGRTNIEAEEIFGTEEDVLLYAIKDNRTHGLKLRYGDLKYAIGKALELSEGKTAGAIAKELGYTRSYVYRIEKALSTCGHLAKSDTLIGASGKTHFKKKSVKKRQKPSQEVKDEVKSNLQHFVSTI